MSSPRGATQGSGTQISIFPELAKAAVGVAKMTKSKKEQQKQRAYRKNKLFRRIEADIKERDRKMLNLFSLRTNNWRNGTQWMGKWTARVIGENNYEYFRLEKRIAYAKYYYTKQAILTQMSLETPDVVNTFSVLAKEDTSHGFPVWRPLERNSDFALYNVNSEGWF